MASKPATRPDAKNVASPMAFATPLWLLGGVLLLGSLPTLYLLVAGRPTAPAPVAQVPPEALEPLRQELVALRAALPEAVKGELARLPAPERPIDPRPDLKTIQKTLNDSKTAWDAWQKEWKAHEAKRPTPPTVPPTNPPARTIVAEDIVIAVLHSGRVSYPRDLKEPLRTLFRERKSPPEQRLALAVLVGDGFEKPMVGWGDKPQEWKPERFDNALPDDDQLAEGPSGAVLTHLTKLLDGVPDGAGRRRLILIASGRCRAPDLKGETWKKVLEKKIRIDVLLIREEEKLAGLSVTHGNVWLEACGQTRGVVSFVQRGEKATMQQEVLAQLRDWIRPFEK